jgi:hypothetical protein
MVKPMGYGMGQTITKALSYGEFTHLSANLTGVFFWTTSLTSGELGF